MTSTKFSSVTTMLMTNRYKNELEKMNDVFDIFVESLGYHLVDIDEEEEPQKIREINKG